jgi:hypothetical protein
MAMQLDALSDDWVDQDDRDVLDLWNELVGETVGDRLGVDDEVTAADMTARLAVLREHGWLEFVNDEDTSDTVYFEAIKRLHRRDLPLAVPLVEIWSALRLLGRVSTDAAADLIAGTLDGERIATLDVSGLFSPHEAGAALRTGWIPFGDAVDILTVVKSGDGYELHALRPGAGVRTAAPCPDPTLPAVTVSGVTPDASTLVATLSPELLATTRAEVLVAQSAALVGQAQAVLRSTVDYLTTREQFGVPIGSFQALRHRAADVAADVYAAQQLSIHAAERVADHPDALALGYLAKSACGRAAMFAAGEAVQLHGGIGFTWEGGVHFGLKRSMYLAMSGISVGACEEELGAWTLSSPTLLWAGGVDSGESD